MTKTKNARQKAKGKQKRQTEEDLVKRSAAAGGPVMDLKSYTHWDECSRARDAMFRETDTDWANIITHLLEQIPYEPLEHHDVELPPRQNAAGNVGPDLHLRHIPTPF